MHEFSMYSSDGREGKFTGELLHKNRSAISLDDGFSREFVLQVYAVDGGGYVSSVEYESTCEFEKSVKLFEVTDDLDEVEKFFYVFDVGEYIIEDSGLTRREVAEQIGIRTQLANAYENLVFSFLDDAQIQITTRGCSDRVQEEPVESGSFWNMFKLS